ncbi:MAG: ribonuclease HII [Candidatus Helarchaeota archaeon]
MPLIAGIEEAGRGPVIGPMVMAIAVIDSDQESRLREMGVKDSKQLSKKQRERLYNKLIGDLLAYEITVIQPNEIDAALMAKNTNLNWLEADISIKLFQTIEKKRKIAHLFVDCPSTNTQAFHSYIHSHLKIDPQCITVEHKADINYPIVSAASILAKVTRDREIENIKKQYNIDFGSGYPSDRKTIEFLKRWVKEHKGFPDFVRKTWATSKKLINELKTRRIDNY